MPQGLEIEAKVHVGDLAAVRRRLTALQAEEVAARVYERNIRYEDAGHSLAGRGAVLRMRQDIRIRLSIKEPSPQRMRGRL